jgi:Rrf2 family protein
MISQTAEYAMRAVVHLAKLGGGPAVAQEIAGATGVPTGYLHKILRALARTGILAAQRGIGGGFKLARRPDEISVLEVMQSVDGGPRRIVRCPLGIAGHESLCALHRMLDETIAAAESRFSRTSILDLLRAERRSGALCERRPEGVGASPGSRPEQGSFPEARRGAKK